MLPEELKAGGIAINATSINAATNEFSAHLEKLNLSPK
jgi:hypothetical protein